jgi:MFS family permease
MVFSMVSSLSSSLAMLILFQVLATAASSASTPLGAAVVTDLWEAQAKGTAFGFFYLGPLVGAAVGPIISGCLLERWDWSSTQWFLAVWAGCCMLIMLTALPETLIHPTNPSEPVSTTYACTEMGSWPMIVRLASKATQPFKVFCYLHLIPVALNVCLAGITFGVSGVMGVNLQATFASDIYHMSPAQVGLTYLPMATGLILASVVGGSWTDHVKSRKTLQRAQNGEDPLIHKVGDRLGGNAWVAVNVLPAAILIYGWTSHSGVHWAVPVSANFHRCHSRAYMHSSS